MTISVKKFKVRKFIDLNAIGNALRTTFHRNHIRAEFHYDGSKEPAFNHYRCFDNFLEELADEFNTNNTGVWSWRHNVEATLKKKPAPKYNNGCYINNPDGAMMTIDLFFEEPDDLKNFIKKKAIILKLQS